MLSESGRDSFAVDICSQLNTCVKDLCERNGCSAVYIISYLKVVSMKSFASVRKLTFCARKSCPSWTNDILCREFLSRLDNCHFLHSKLVPDWQLTFSAQNTCPSVTTDILCTEFLSQLNNCHFPRSISDIACTENLSQLYN